MVTVEIQLSDEQARRLDQVAQTEGVSLEEVVRRSIERYVMEQEATPHRALDRAELAELRRRSLALVGKYGSDASDVSENHDRYLADIYGDVTE